MKDLSISVFFPAYNDEKTIPILIEDATSVLKPLTDDYEIIIIDDCSPDNIGMIVDEIAKKDKHVKVIHHEKNRGYGGALKSGFKAATKDYIFYTDGDAQYDVKELKKLLKYAEDYDVVNGYKIKRRDKFYRMLLGKMYNKFARTMFNMNQINDVDCDFRMFKKNVIKDINLESDGGFICVEMMYKIHRAKYKIKEVPVNHYPRKYGKSQFFNFRRVARTLSNFAGGWWKLVIWERLKS
ncbi:MAG: glycosyltransferase family 2 protein [Nanoarchaeota archaeon]|nr:glycosyltransferase family 2 protein [Nanoarchaeota archaeon]MCG2718024.1 glycosyltransferase family 2 protein [Nanoarchaeota archaeon]